MSHSGERSLSLWATLNQLGCLSTPFAGYKVQEPCDKIASSLNPLKQVTRGQLQNAICSPATWCGHIPSGWVLG